MNTRNEAIEYCMQFRTAYEDYPFDDFNWTVMRRRDTRRGFAWIFEREGNIWVNIKADPGQGELWQMIYPSVLPGYHMNHRHWCSIILDGSVPHDEICRMISSSYELCGKSSGSKKR